MFKARVKMEVLREAVEVISTLVSEVKLSISKEGIEVKAVDPSHVAMLVLKLKNTVFEEFTGEPTEIVTKGRHDPCVGIRAVAIGEAMMAIVLADHWLRQRAQCG